MLKGFIKQPVIKQIQLFLTFLFSLINVWMFFLFPYQSFSKFLSIKNWENLKLLTKIFCQKLIVYNVISAYLDHLKPKLFFAGNLGGRHRAPPFSKSLDPPLLKHVLFLFWNVFCSLVIIFCMVNTVKRSFYQKLIIVHINLL